MSEYYLAPALAQLRTEIDQKWPGRNKAADGWVGDASHQARKSDHNPDWQSIPPGVVRAIDVTSDGNGSMAAEVMKVAIGDPRVWYVIHDRLIYSRTYGFRPRAYTGANAHTHHVHISLRGADGISQQQAGVFARDESLWFKPTAPRVTVLPKPNNVQKARRRLQRTIDALEATPASRIVAHATATRLQRDLDRLPER